LIVEVIVQNGEEGIQAEKSGANRLELVSAMKEGGLTPSYGTMKQVLHSVTIPVNVVIEPHSFHYNYGLTEWEIIREDIKKMLDIGGTKIAFGVLNEDKTINQKFLEDVIKISPDLEITFHRAFDQVDSQIKALETLCMYKENIKCILTSGGKEHCIDGQSNLKKLVQLSKEKNGPEIMPCAGLSLSNIVEIHKNVKANQYHFGRAVRIDNSYSNPIDGKVIRELNNLLKD